MNTLCIGHFISKHTLLNWRVIKLCKATLRCKSATATSIVDKNYPLEQTNKSTSPLPNKSLDFTNTSETYKSKRTSEILRAILVLKLSSYEFLVNNHVKLINIGKTILGENFFRFIMKATFYGNFVAGEDEVSIKPTIEHLKSFGVKSILDYSAEEDIHQHSSNGDKRQTIPKQEVKTDQKPETPIGKDAQKTIMSPGVQEKQLKKFVAQSLFPDQHKFHITARTYFYLNEAQCEKNMETFLKCIDAVAGVTAHTGFAAIKLTALGRPQLLLQLSEVIARTRLFFKEVTGIDKMALGQVTPQQFSQKIDKRFKIKTDNAEIKEWFSKMDYDRRGLMNLFSWNGLVDMQSMISDTFKVPNIKTGKMESIITALTAEEEEMFRNMMRRIHTIASNARSMDVRVMIDAEQSYFQPAINRITLELMRKYNKEKAIIFNTYQCYLKNAYENVLIDLELAQRQDFYFGAKIVRGAYMEQERMRAKEIGYEDPINVSYEATTEMYHKTFSHLLEQIVEKGLDSKKIAVMVATHNEDTVRFAVEKMKELSIDPRHKVICFGQLFGMCDHISFLLGQTGYSVYKYVPYGPVDKVLPYLSRRAVENHGILEKSFKEQLLMKKELFRRLMSGQLFHKPVGNHTPI